MLSLVEEQYNMGGLCLSQSAPTHTLYHCRIIHARTQTQNAQLISMRVEARVESSQVCCSYTLSFVLRRFVFLVEYNMNECHVMSTPLLFLIY